MNRDKQNKGAEVSKPLPSALRATWDARPILDRELGPYIIFTLLDPSRMSTHVTFLQPPHVSADALGHRPGAMMRRFFAETDMPSAGVLR